MIKSAIILLLAPFVMTCAYAAEPSGKDMDWRQRQEIWWRNSDSLVDGIVTFARVRFLAKSDDTLLAEVTDSQVGLLLILDSDSSDAALTNLARLSSYYLGEAPGEIYQCVVLRKGTRMLPALKQQLARRDSDECVGKHGDSKLCVSNLRPEGHLAAVSGLIAAIERDAPCTLER